MTLRAYLAMAFSDIIGTQRAKNVDLVHRLNAAHDDKLARMDTSTVLVVFDTEGHGPDFRS